MTVTDPTLAGLLAGVLATPDAGLPRLVLADWLEENGEPERAEFIRVQCELAKIESGKKTSRGRLITITDEYDALRRREGELWPQLRIDGWACHEFPIVGMWWPGDRTEVDVKGIVRRGFVESVTCDLTTLFGRQCENCSSDNPQLDERGMCPVCKGDPNYRTTGIAPRLFASQPVQQITLSDVRPMRHRILAGHRYGYELRDDNARDAWQLPAELFQHLPKADFFVNDYRRWWWTEENALSALSVALVAYGRANAEGMTHEAVCESCSGEGCDFKGHGDQKQFCDGSGWVRKPGLPPLAVPTSNNPTLAEV